LKTRAGKIWKRKDMKGKSLSELNGVVRGKKILKIDFRPPCGHARQIRLPLNRFSLSPGAIRRRDEMCLRRAVVAGASLISLAVDAAKLARRKLFAGDDEEAALVVVARARGAT
jgi:hypothetical protein